jgi:membrane-bound lytic murein transglycosylase D
LPLEIEAPNLTVAWYASEVPNSSASLPSVARPSDTDFLIKKADDRFTAGKRAFQEGRTEDARKEFDRVIEVLATAPENLMDRARLERHIEELVESIYRYDVDDSAATDADPEVSFDKSPIDDLLQMTFPIDPSLRNKVQEQIRATASQLPLEENDAVVSYINFFSSPRGKKILAYGMKRSGRYKPMIERILREEGVPEELIFLAQAESGFSPRAMSRALCVGVWQFAAFRGREYGLMQTPATDDRMDPERATQAAARHLHDLYNHFGDWNLAMAAYNCGPGCIDHAIQRTGYADFWTLRRLNVLPKETANYVPAILAMTIVGKNAKDYGLDDLDLDQPLDYDTVELESSTHLALVADALDRPLAELREINPSLIRSVAPAGAALHVPKGSLPQLEAAFQTVPANRRDAWRLHRLEADDTFITLARRYNTSAALVSTANHDALPEAGAFVAIPAAYPGDRVPVRTVSRTRTTARSTTAKTSGIKTSGIKTAGARTTARPAAHAASQIAAKKPTPAAKPRAAAPVRKTPTKAAAPNAGAGRAG